MEARRFCFLYNFCHHAGQRARRIPVYLHRRRRRSCVFIHYSDSNIREKTLLEVLQSPLFMAYHDNQPFNENMLRPCPMLENPEALRAMVKKPALRALTIRARRVWIISAIRRRPMRKAGRAPRRSFGRAVTAAQPAGRRSKRDDPDEAAARNSP